MWVIPGGDLVPPSRWSAAREAALHVDHQIDVQKHATQGGQQDCDVPAPHWMGPDALSCGTGLAPAVAQPVRSGASGRER